MTGIGRSFGAITVINAMPCGIGATIGTSLTTKARFGTGSDSHGHEVNIINDPSESTKMAELCVSAVYSAAGIPEPDSWHLDILSEIPISRGLKSSSSACNAIISSVSDECGFHLDLEDTVRLGIDCAREAKVTVTGSFDDAAGCHLGGFVMTDNRTDELILRKDFPEHDVVICVPDEKIRKTSLDIGALKAVSEKMEEAIEVAKRDPLEAMSMNGRIIAEASGLDNTIADAAIEHGALGAGISGSGPAVAIVLKPGSAAGFLEGFDIKYNTVITHTKGARR
jgi:shikimate kinase